MTPTAAELSSMAATVEDLTVRLISIARSYETAGRDDLVSDVHEVERALVGAQRRMRRLLATDGA